MSFRGFPPAAFEFYERLRAENTPEFWTANKATYDQAVRGPMRELCAEFPDVGPFHIFRPYQDRRFVKDRPPYKDHQGAIGESEGGSSFYVHVSADGMLVGAGYYHLAADQLVRYRGAVDREATGTELVAIVERLRSAGLSVTARDVLKRAPRGVPLDHPRLELLRFGGLIATRSWPVSAWMHTARASARVAEQWAVAAPLCAWMDRHVGPSTLPPPDAER